MHIGYVMLLEFKNYKDATETATIISNIYGQVLITDRHVGKVSFLQHVSGKRN